MCRHFDLARDLRTQRDRQLEPFHCDPVEDTPMAQDITTKFRRPARDLTAVRQALTAIRNDLQQDAELDAAATAVTKALEELAIAEHLSRPLPVLVHHWTLPSRGH
jgi:hypothetical protein